MPQFDQFSFFNQVSWFFFFFLIFYFCTTYFFLPKICYSIKFRKKKILNNKKKNKQINFEKINIIFFFNNFYKNFSLNFNNFLLKKKTIYKFNQKKNINKKFLINLLLTQKINFILNKNFISLKKIFI